MTAKVIYKGDLRTVNTHFKSGESFITDAPTDNNGKGEAFSPTDLVATALANCMVTIMGIRAQKSDWNIDGAMLDVSKTMANDPRRISKIRVDVTIPAGDFDQKTKDILEKAARECPVAASLHPDIEQDISFNWLQAQ